MSPRRLFSVADWDVYGTYERCYQVVGQVKPIGDYAEDGYIAVNYAGEAIGDFPRHCDALAAVVQANRQRDGLET